VRNISLNINGDLPAKELIERVKIAEEAGVREIWIGEHELFRDPVKVAKEIEYETNSEINLLLSPSRRRCSEIMKIAKKYRIALISGRSREIKPFILCLEKVRKVADEIYAGVSGKKITELASKYADGLLLNYVHIKFVEWIKNFMKRNIPVSAFGPCLILPSHFYEDLLVASAVVMKSNSVFLKTFGLDVLSKEIPEDFSRMIRTRQAGKSVKVLPEFKPIEKYSGTLLELFTISGSFKEVFGRISQLLKLCDNVVLGDPFFRDIDSLNSLKNFQ